MTTTAAALTEEIESRAERIRELTTTEQELEASLTSARNAIASALAGGALPDPAGARESVRSNSEELEGVRGAIALLTKERETLEAQLKKAQAREATERANQSASEAQRAINAVDAAIVEAGERILALASELNGKLNVANGDDQIAKSLNGQQAGIVPRSGLWQKPGLDEFLTAVRNYVYRQEVRVA